MSVSIPGFRPPGAPTAALALACATFIAGLAPAVASGELRVTCVSERARPQCVHARALNSPIQVSIAPRGRNVYIAGKALISLARKPGSGAVRQLAATKGCITPSPAAARAQRCRLQHGLGWMGPIATTPDGRFVYVGSARPAGIHAFRRNRHTGVLQRVAGGAGCLAPARRRGCGVARAIGSPGSLAVSRDNRFLYVTSVDDSAVAVFSRNRTTGALHQLRGTAGCVAEVGRGPASCATARGISFAQAIALSPNGRQVYVVGGTSTDLEATGDGSVAVFSRSARSGGLRQLSGSAGCVVPLGGGRPEDAPCTPAARGLGATALYSVAVSRDGRNVYANGWSADRGVGFAYGDVVTFSRSAADGSLTQPSDPAACFGHVPGCKPAAVGGLGGVAVAPTGRFVFATGDSTLAAFNRVASTGLLSVRRIVRNRKLLSEVGAPAVTPDARDVFVPSTTVGGAAPGTSPLGFDVAIFRGL